MADKFPKFEYVPALAKYMLTFIDRLPSHNAEHPEGIWYKVKEDVPDQVHAAFFDLDGSSEERYDILLELSDAANTDVGVEDYIEEIEPPVYTSDLLNWMSDDYTYTRLDWVNAEIRNSAESLEDAISYAWIYWKRTKLQSAAAVLENYLNSGSEDAEEDE